MRSLRQKKAAIEMSMSTIVVLVLAMSMLILGLVLVRTIFKTATNSVNELDNKVRAEITNLFVDESNKVIVKLGSDYTARITAGTTNFGVAIGAKTLSGSPATKSLKFTLSFDTNSNNCYKLLKASGMKTLFKQTVGTAYEFDKFEGDEAFAIIQIDIPEGTPLCSQKVYVDVKDGGEVVGRTVFIVDIIRKGFF